MGVIGLAVNDELNSVAVVVILPARYLTRHDRAVRHLDLSILERVCRIKQLLITACDQGQAEDYCQNDSDDFLHV